MNELPTASETFVLRRLADPLPGVRGVDESSLALAAGAVAVVGLALAGWRFRANRSALGTATAGVILALRLLAIGLLTFAVALPTLNVEDVGNVAWLAVTGAGVLLAVAAVGAMYATDRRAVGWRAVPLAASRSSIFLLLAWAFLLPAIQTWERSEKRSKVVVLIDVSPSVRDVTDTGAGSPRLEAILDTLSGETGLLGKLTATNPVTVYRFGGKLDEQGLRADADTAITAADWRAFARYDFKPWLLGGVSEPGRQLVRATLAWGGDAAGTAEWATQWANLPSDEAVPTGLIEADRQALESARTRLERRIDVARAVESGTALTESIAAAFRQEAGNLLQGVVVFSDGRSTQTSEIGVKAVRDLAEREKVPVFTVVVGDARESVEIQLADLQAPEAVPPNEEFKVVVEADGIGLADAKTPVTLELFLPGRNPKSAAPDFVLPARDLAFNGESVPPRGQVEFGIDPADLPESLTEEVPDNPKAPRRLKQGSWQFVARTPRHERELAGGEAHKSPPRSVEVIDRPTRILLFASGPTREYQTLRTLLVREAEQKRAELTIYLQTQSGKAGTAVQDVPPERLLTRFPTRYDTRAVPAKPGERFDNLNEFDLVIAFDPDWSELSAEQVENLAAWADNGGGGLLYVAGPLHTFQLARADEDGRLKPLLNLLPVVPDDIILVKTRPIPRSPRRLILKPSAEYDLLRLAEQPEGDPVAGWEKFFTGSELLSPGTPRAELVAPKRGFYSYYPLKATKPGAATVAELLEPGESGGEPEPRPWLVTAQPSAGRTVFLASGESWLLRGFSRDYFDRFWVKLIRYTAGGRKATGNPRGRVLVAREAVSGAQVGVQVKLLAPNGKPYPPDAVSPKFRVETATATGEKLKEFGPYELRPRLGGSGFDGYYAGQVLADPAKFPPGEARFKVVVDVPESPGEVLTGEFRLKRSDPELDDIRPDADTLAALAGTLEEVRVRVKEPAVIEAMQSGNADPKAVRLSFRLKDRNKLDLIPKMMDSAVAVTSNRGPVRDLWDDPASLAPVGIPAELLAVTIEGRRYEVGWLLLLATLLLGVEWLTRKLLRLA